MITPWGIEWWLWKGSARKLRRRIRARLALEAPPRNTRVEVAIRYLVDRGLDEFDVREGSMPEASLDYVADTVVPMLSSDRPLRVLHIGNFVGVSLCYISWLVSEQHPDSLIVSIDPNIPCRGIHDPQSHALALLDHFGLLSRNLIITGYTLERSEEAASEADHQRGLACENVLGNLAALWGARFDFVLIDGNHDPGYLAREIAAIRGLLYQGGLIVVDDLTDWPGVGEVFRQTAQANGWTQVGDDERVGILQLGTVTLGRAATTTPPETASPVP
jgi:predicted O-methyltransferase YrrM